MHQMMLPVLIALNSILLILHALSSTSCVLGESLLYSPERLLSRLDLNSPGVQWILKRSDGRLTIPATVPGDVYSDLMAAGVIPDPVTEFNDVKTRWVVSYNWTYTAQFNVSKSLVYIAPSTEIDLIFLGLDTVAVVRVNEVPVLQCNNFWRVYRATVRSILRPGVNTISVEITSPVPYARRAAQEYALQFGYQVPPDCPPETYNGECYFNFIRKPAYSFSWDWGPAVPTSGIWRPVFLQIYEVALTYVKFSARPRIDLANAWQASVIAGVRTSGLNDWRSVRRQACIRASIQNATDQDAFQCFDLLPDQGAADNITVVLNFETLINPELWWPNGFGNQRLYNLLIALCIDGPECRTVEQENRRVAFRTVELRQTPLGTQLPDGLSFEFVINSQPLFVKGANFVPTGMVIAAATAAADYRMLMESAAAVGINMLRVWGGGTIERPEFYDLADELGILIWQDFMFACALYPTDSSFLETVQLEIRDSVRRLQTHPSVAAWVANNENEGALANEWWQLKPNRSRYYSDYRQLYMRTVRSVTLAEDETRPVLLSSPTNGDETEWEGGIAKQPQSTKFGDVHYYSYTEDMWLSETIPLTRFMSEFGFQSFPSLVTLLSATKDPRNVAIDSNFTQHREHQPNGTVTIARHNARHFSMEPPCWLLGVNDGAIATLLANYSVPASEMKQVIDQLSTYMYQSYVSQVDQAEIYRRVTHLHAIHRCRLTPQMEGYSSGVMFWQLNDVWAAPTWSTIEHSGAWKVAHYFAQRYYASRRVVMLKTVGGNISAAYIDESRRGADDVTVVGFACYNINSFVALRTWQIRVNVMTSYCPFELFNLPEAGLISYCNCDNGPNNCMLEATVQSNANAKDVFAEQYYFDVPKNQKRDGKPNLAVNVTKIADGKFLVELTATTPLFAVHLQLLCPELARATFSDNGFHMTSSSKKVRLTVPSNSAWHSVSTETIYACFAIHYL